MQQRSDNLIDLARHRNREGIFVDRHYAGHVLEKMLAGDLDPDSVIIAVPAGGIPVAFAMAEPMGLGVDVVVISKITFPWNKV